MKNTAIRHTFVATALLAAVMGFTGCVSSGKFNDTVAQLSGDIETANTANKAVSRDVDSLRSENEAAINELKTELQGLRTELAASKTELAAARTAMQAAEADRTRREGEVMGKLQQEFTEAKEVFEEIKGSRVTLSNLAQALPRIESDIRANALKIEEVGTENVKANTALRNQVAEDFDKLQRSVGLNTEKLIGTLAAQNKALGDALIAVESAQREMKVEAQPYLPSTLSNTNNAEE